MPSYLAIQVSNSVTQTHHTYTPTTKPYVFHIIIPQIYKHIYFIFYIVNKIIKLEYIYNLNQSINFFP